MTGRRYLIAGARVAGVASARVLLDRGAEVTILDRDDKPVFAELRAAGARTVVGDEVDLAGFTDVVLSPGFAPHHPLAVAATTAGLDVYSEPELAWRLRPPGAAEWLAITGTNGKTTATTMLASILAAAGLRTAALGNIGEPLVFAATGGDYDVLAVELSSFQLHWSSTLAPHAGALLNLADDHLDWHGGFEAYALAKTAIWRAASTGGASTGGVAAGGVAVGNLDDPRVAALLSKVDGKVVGFTLGEPGPGQLGVVDGVLVHDGVELAAVADIRPPGSYNVANALAAAALARGYGVPASAVRDGLAGYTPQPHRNAYVASVGGVGYVDDSKATNPHAAAASLTAYPRVIWIAGGQLKGVDVSDLVRDVADRLAGAVLLGADRAEVAAALARHAPGVPVVTVDRTDDGAMAEVVHAAAALAKPGDTVLLAPAAASLDMYASYARRGEAFAAAVQALGTSDR